MSNLKPEQKNVEEVKARGRFNLTSDIFEAPRLSVWRHSAWLHSEQRRSQYQHFAPHSAWWANLQNALELMLCRYAEWHWSKCRYTECHGAVFSAASDGNVAFILFKLKMIFLRRIPFPSSLSGDLTKLLYPLSLTIPTNKLECFSLAFVQV